MKEAINKAYSFWKEGLCNTCSNREKTTLKHQRLDYSQDSKLEIILDNKLLRRKKSQEEKNKSEHPKLESSSKGSAENNALNCKKGEISLSTLPNCLSSSNILFNEGSPSETLKELDVFTFREGPYDEKGNSIHIPSITKIDNIHSKEGGLGNFKKETGKKKIGSHEKIISKTRKQKGTPWEKSEDQLLIEAVKKNNYKNWKEISKHVPGRSSTQCSQRWRRIQPYKSREPWTKDEDKELLELVKNYGKNWSLIASNLDGRTGKQVRERYLNCLNPDINREKFTEEEDEKIVAFYKQNGAKWKVLSSILKGRTENMVKNRFYSFLKRKYNIQDDADEVIKYDKQSMEVELD